MADPNTQIDWWIAQAWQEAQGGAENDDLVAWLHENGLTAISSYTILQAALGCTPDEAKNIVFGHPAWAGAAGDLDVANLDYTSDTLEPEPEPDPAFELDDWAEEVEEGPVYGEEGYQPTTVTGPAESPMPEPEQAFATAYGSDESGGYDDEPAGVSMPDAQAFDPAPQPAPAPPPFLRTPPSTPAERAAVFAGAFGKKPAAAQTPAPAHDTSPAPEPPPSSPPDTEPPSSDAGPAVEAEPAPAQYEPENPHPAMATAELPPTLAHEPLPEIEMPPPMAPAEPLFGAESRDPHLDEPLFPPAATAQPVVGPGALESLDDAALFGDNAREDMTAPTGDGSPGYVHASLHAHGESEPAIASNGFDAAVTEDPEPEPESESESEPAGAGSVDDLPPGMRAAMEQNGGEPPEALALPENEQDDDLPSIDRERAVLSLAGEDPSRTRKPALLDPAAEVADDESPIGGPGNIPLGDSPEEMARAAKLLGINFDGGDSTETDMDLEMIQAAKDLGISFREGADRGDSIQESDELALEAQRLGISFREGGAVSNSIEKPTIVRYMPIILGVIIIFFLLLIGATFADVIIAWFMN